MRCNECRSRLFAGPPGTFVLSSYDRDVTNHLENCAECRGFLERQGKLAEELRRMAAETSPPVLSGQTEKFLTTAFDRRVSRSRRVGLSLSPRLVFALPAALCVVALIVAGIHHERRHSVPIEPAQTDAESEQFVAVPYVVPPAPYERTEVVRMQVSLSALRALGFQVHTPETGGSVAADVLCGQDGRVVAISILPDSMNAPKDRME